jgi:SPP1 gp7 family putative phage head morphogenesis protein
MLSMMQTAERSRLTDRHGAQRGEEVRGLRAKGAIKALPTDDPAVAKLADALRRYLAGEYATAADAVRAMAGVAQVSRGAVEQLPLDTGDAVEKIVRRFYPLFVQAGWDEGAQQIGADLAYDLANPKIQEVLDELARLVRGVSDTTRDDIRALVGRQAAEGWDMPTLARMIAQIGEINSRSRALLIARTESAAAQSRGALAAWAESGVVDRVRWLATGESCPECQALDGEVRAMGAPFAPGIMMPPAHPNCTCALMAVLEGA